MGDSSLAREKSSKVTFYGGKGTAPYTGNIQEVRSYTTAIQWQGDGSLTGEINTRSNILYYGDTGRNSSCTEIYRMGVYYTRLVWCGKGQLTGKYKGERLHTSDTVAQGGTAPLQEKYTWE
jgi:hypothetical protein